MSPAHATLPTCQSQGATRRDDDISEEGRMPQIEWSPFYQPAWDDAPDTYVACGTVAWGRSRRLGKYVDDVLGLKAYVGVQHYDPARWGAPGEPRAVFFLSLFLDGQTVTLRTFPRMGAARAALAALRTQVGAS